MTFTFSGAGTLGTIIESILYGAYAVLFTLYLILWRRNNRGFGGALTLAQMLLFCLCTLSLCFDISVDYLLVVPDAKSSDAANKLNLSSMVLFALIDCVAQVILLYRCWIIWDRRWVVVAVPGFLVLITLGGAFALVGLDNSPLWKIDEARAIHLCKSTGIATNTVSLVVNALTTSLIVTKIFLTSLEVRSALGSNSHRGLLIFTFQLAFVVLSDRDIFGIISGPTTQIYGITPTLLNIRVVMGSTYDKTTERTRTLRFARSEGGTATQTTGTSMSAARIRSRGINIEPDDISNNERAADDAS